MPAAAAFSLYSTDRGKKVWPSLTLVALTTVTRTTVSPLRTTTAPSARRAIFPVSIVMGFVPTLHSTECMLIIFLVFQSPAASSAHSDRLRAGSLNGVRYGQCLRKSVIRSSLFPKIKGNTVRAAGRTSQMDQTLRPSLTGLTACENPKISQGMPDRNAPGNESPNVGCQHKPCQGECKQIV